MGHPAPGAGLASATLLDERTRSQLAQVDHRDHGEISVKPVYGVGGYVMSAEQQVVKDVASGSFDLGFTGTSVFDTLGVTSLEALSAPLLIDSYPLENAVITSALPGKMMAGLGKLDVTGLAVWGDGMRRPIGVKHPILSLADWRGIRFGTYDGCQEVAPAGWHYAAGR